MIEWEEQVIRPLSQEERELVSLAAKDIHACLHLNGIIFHCLPFSLMYQAECSSAYVRAFQMDQILKPGNADGPEIFNGLFLKNDLWLVVMKNLSKCK